MPHRGALDFTYVRQTTGRTPLIAVLVVLCAVSSSNIYLVQPLLAQMAVSLGAGAAQVSAIATAIQVGYAVGIALLVPLGDVRRRRPLMLMMVTGSFVAMAALAAAPDVSVAVVAGALLGVFSAVPQLAIPYAVGVADDLSVGRVVGLMQAGHWSAC